MLVKFRWLSLILWITSLIFLVHLSIIPGDNIPSPFPHLDKLYHFGYYLWLSLLWVYSAGANWKTVPGIIFMFIIGVLLEFVQGGIPQRTFSILDIAANLSGLVAGPWVLSYFCYRKYFISDS